jgi:hypothetical protein
VEDIEGLHARVHGFVSPPRLADYAGRYAEHAELRRSGGVLYGIEVPTISAINGPASGFAFEFMTDLVMPPRREDMRK